MGNGVRNVVADKKVFRDPRVECGRHQKRKQANHQAFQSVNPSKYLEKKEKQHVVRNYGGMFLVQGERVRTLITWESHLSIPSLS